MYYIAKKAVDFRFRVSDEGSCCCSTLLAFTKLGRRRRLVYVINSLQTSSTEGNQYLVLTMVNIEESSLDSATWGKASIFFIFSSYRRFESLCIHQQSLFKRLSRFSYLDMHPREALMYSPILIFNSRYLNMNSAPSVDAQRTMVDHCSLLEYIYLGISSRLYMLARLHSLGSWCCKRNFSYDPPASLIFPFVFSMTTSNHLNMIKMLET